MHNTYIDKVFSAVEVGFANTNYMATEDVGTLAVCAILISGVVMTDVIVDVSTSDGSGV